jgi:hypothetical protein
MRLDYSAGQDCDAWCNKCKMVLRHVIHAVVQGKPVRVECKTCRAIHRFKASEKATATRRTRTARRAAQPKEDKSLMEWERLTAGKTFDDGRRYQISETFEAGEFVVHIKFGLGVVKQVLPSRKIEVHFKDQVKTLVHQR